MPITLIVLPVISFVIGLFSIFSDPKNPKRKKWVAGLIIALLIACFATIFFNFDENRKKEAEKANLKNEIVWLKGKISELISNLKDFRADAEEGFSNLKELLGFGLTGNRIQNLAEKNNITEAIKVTRKADEEIKKLVASTPQAWRQNTIVEFFPKDVDPKIVEEALKGFDFVLKRSSPELPGDPTNSIWFGANIRIENVKIVALTLIRAGVEINMISPFRKPHGKRSNLIQVGTWKAYLNNPPLTINEIVNAREFTRPS